MAILVSGASSAIAQAVIRRLLTSGQYPVHAISRQQMPEDIKALDSVDSGLHWHVSDYSDHGIAAICRHLHEADTRIARVYIFNGILHGEDIFPEKRLADISMASMQKVWQVDAFTPVLWLKHLQLLLKKSSDCIITILSARIGSITDNNLGGWYSYRMAKAALNMGVKTAAVEYSRTARCVRFLLFHPGTTDSPLSRPFQRNVKPEKLFEPGFVAEKLEQILQELPAHKQLSYLDWQGMPIDW